MNNSTKIQYQQGSMSGFFVPKTSTLILHYSWFIEEGEVFNNKLHDPKYCFSKDDPIIKKGYVYGRIVIPKWLQRSVKSTRMLS